MANHNRAAGEFEQRFLKSGQSLGVQVVGGLVEQKQVAALLQGERQVQAVALATGKNAGGFLLVGALEAEGGHVGTAGDLGFAHHHEVGAARDNLPQLGVGVDALAVLVDVADLHRFAHLKRARGQRLQADDGLEQRGFAHAVGADNADDAVAGQLERKVVDQHASVEFFMQMLGHQHLVAQARAHGNVDLGVVDVLGGTGLGLHLLVGGQARLALGLAGFGARAHPFELALHLLGKLGLLLALRLDARGLGFQVSGVVALVGEQLPAVDLADPFGNVVEEVAVVRDGKHGARVVLQELLKPQH